MERDLNPCDSFYYTGDTGYYDLFEQVYNTLGEPDLMLADSGQYDKGWATTHMFPEEYGGGLMKRKVTGLLSLCLVLCLILAGCGSAETGTGSETGDGSNDTVKQAAAEDENVNENAHEQFGSIYAVPDEYDMFGGWIHVGRNYAADIWDIDFYDELSRYEGDVLLLHGDRDSTVDISYSERAAEVIPNCEFHVISGAGHEFFGEHFDEAMGYILDYMERVMNKNSDTGDTGASENQGELSLMIGDTPVSVVWEDNESVEALKELVTNEPLEVQMSMYSTFEQVGSLGTSLPRNDVQTTTEAGDIVLYSGNQIVIFYGSNSWAYTRFGKITDKTASEMAELLGNGDVSITISLVSDYGGNT